MVQIDGMGCGVACLAFTLNVPYVHALKLLKSNRAQASSKGFYCRDLVAALLRAKQAYEYKHIQTVNRRRIYKDGVIVFIKRSKRYPAGHYLCRYKNFWMDSWMNFPENQNIKNAKAGFRKRLPAKPICAMWPIS